MGNEGVTPITGRKLRLLHLLHIGRHPTLGVVLCQVKHVEPHGVNARQGDELVFVPHGAQLALELGNRGIVQVLSPIERWRAVVGQHFAGMNLVHRFGKLTSELQVGGSGFTPHQIGIVGISDST